VTLDVRWGNALRCRDLVQKLELECQLFVRDVTAGADTSGRGMSLRRHLIERIAVKRQSHINHVGQAQSAGHEAAVPGVSPLLQDVCLNASLLRSTVNEDQSVHRALML
jgi:hypothetical protein